MASDGSPGAIAAVSAVLNPQASNSAKFQPVGGKTLPQSGNSAAAAAAAAAVALKSAENTPQGNKSVAPSVSSASVNSNAAVKSGNSASTSNSAKSTAATPDPQSLVTQINKHLNNSGQADQFRVDPDSDSYIQQVNPASGEVIAQYAVNEFPALARSIGAAGLLIDDTA